MYDIRTSDIKYLGYSDNVPIEYSRGVVNIDAYFTNIDNFSNSYLICFCDEGRIGNNGFDSSRNYGIFGVVYGEQDAYFGSIYADDMLVCLSWRGYFNNWSYKNADKNGVVVVIERCLFYL